MSALEGTRRTHGFAPTLVVGWVERSETHLSRLFGGGSGLRPLDGLHPAELCFTCETKLDKGNINLYSIRYETMLQ